MPGSKRFLLIGGLSVVALGIIAILSIPVLARSFFYPKPNGLPPIVPGATDQLLARLQSTIESNAPPVALALQPGLSDVRISELESRNGFRLSDDLRALYRWHNGMARNAEVDFLPGQRFVPLEEAVAERTLMRQQSGLVSSVFLSHRKDWLHVLDDGAGDGYFYDPHRSDAEGAFFFHFAESAHYVWFPSLRNFLLGVAECYETQAVKLAKDGKTLDEDLDRTGKIWSRLGRMRHD